MDTTGNFKTALEMSKNNLFTAVAKHITVEEWVEFASKHPEALEVI
jgi:GMP reductase